MEDIALSDRLRANYDNYCEGGSEWRWLSAIDKVNNILALCNRYPHKTILDIGSGEGSVLKRLSDIQFGEELYSIEISRSATEAIRQREVKSLMECRFFDGYNIPYEDNKFVLAILSHVIEHLEYPRKILHEASRVSKYIFVEVPLEDNLRLKKDFVFERVGHINFYSPKTIRRLLQTCGLEVLSQVVRNQSFNVYKYMFGKKAFARYLAKEMLLWAVPGIATMLFTYRCFLVCRRNKA